MELVRPTPEHLPSYIAALERGWSPDSTRGVEAAREALANIAADPDSIFVVADDPEGAGPAWTGPDGVTRPRLPGRIRWIWDEDGFAGSINLRWMTGHAPLPSHVLGHIGYTVPSWKRRLGYATRALRLMLPMARSEGMSFVELTTDEDNEPSQKVILANGGVLAGRFIKDAMWGGQPSCRFRIDL